MGSICRILTAWLVLSSPALATTCDPFRGESLKRSERIYFNLYDFSSFDDLGRCRNLQAAIHYQHELTVWTGLCDPGSSRSALLRLADLTGREGECQS